MVLMGLLGFASNVYASVNFREISNKISIIFDDEDSFDERCNSVSYRNVKYCVCNIGQLNPPENATMKTLKFRGKNCLIYTDYIAQYPLPKTALRRNISEVIFE